MTFNDRLEKLVADLDSDVFNRCKQIGAYFTDYKISEITSHVDDEYHWDFELVNSNQKLFCTLTLTDSLYIEGEETGVNWRLEVGDNSRLMIDCMLYNYTPEVWVPMDRELVMQRLDEVVQVVPHHLQEL